MPVGPVEVIVLGFPGNKFTGGILPELRRLIENDTIHIIDALLVVKDADGSVTYVELEDLEASHEAKELHDLLEMANEGIVNDEDAMEVAADLEPNSSAAILCFEHTWAIPFQQAVMASGGLMLDNFRVPAEIVNDVLAAAAESN